MTGAGLLGVLRLAIGIVWLLVLGRVLLSWVDPTGRSQLGQTLYRLTEPMLAPIRSVLPRTSALDLSPLVLFLVLGVLLRVVL
ncbi:MAG: YggT family protein [Chloroflexota bacterium]